MIFPIVIGLTILSIFLMFTINKKNKVLSDKYLIAIILFFMGILASQILMENWPSIGIYLIVLFLNTYYFPVLVIYGLILLDGKNKLQRNWLWVFAYPVIYNVFLVLDLFVFNDYNTMIKPEALFKKPSDYQLFFYITQYIYVIVLLIWLARKLNLYTLAIKNVHSSIEHINLNWFRNFTVALLGLSCTGFVIFLCFSLGFIENIEIPFGIEYVIFVLLLFYLCYNGIRQYSIADLNFGNPNAIHKPTYIEKYQSSNLDDLSIDKHFQQIVQLFDEENVFLEPQLKIDDIAKTLDISVHKVSQVINSKSNNNFYDFVNRYRVEHFKKLLSDPKHRKFTILSLGIESGFNSKASMNRVFKNYEGKSPKDFQKSIQDT